VFVRTGYHTQVPEISGKLNGKNQLSHGSHHFCCGALVGNCYKQKNIRQPRTNRSYGRAQEEWYSEG
jgi:hypothetical protein